MAREFARKFYNSTEWKQCREGYKRSRAYLCEDCLKRGVYNPGVIVHHIEELTPFNIDNPNVTLNYDNLRLLCRECHAKEHDNRFKNKRYIIDDEGKIIIKA